MRQGAAEKGEGTALLPLPGHDAGASVPLHAGWHRAHQTICMRGTGFCCASSQGPFPLLTSGRTRALREQRCFWARVA